MRKLKRFLGGRLFPCALFFLVFLLILGALAAFLPRALAPLAVAERIFSLCAGIAVLASGELPEYKTAKLLLLVLLPWVGAALCLFLRSRFVRRAYSPVPAKEEDLFSHCARLAETLCGMAPCKAGSAEFFPVGREMYERLLKDLSAAKQSIYLEYYIVAEGKFWGDVLSVLEEKAKTGVDVRLIYDDFGCALTLPRGFEKSMRKKGIKCLAARKIFPRRGTGRRDHRKITVIDGEIAYTGGLNLADEYIGEKIRFGHWKDSAVRLTGEPAQRFSAVFARCWNANFPADAVPTPCAAFEGDKPCLVFCDNAAERERAGARIFSAVIHGARKKLFFTTPYLAPDATLLCALKTVAAAGVDVRILIPRLPDKKTVFAITRSYARELEETGVHVREYAEGFMHAKNLIADGETAIVSTYNFDFRSMYLQGECGALLHDKAFSAAVERDFLTAWETGAPVPAASGWNKLFGGVMRLFAPLV